MDFGWSCCTDRLVGALGAASAGGRARASHPLASNAVFILIATYYIVIQSWGKRSLSPRSPPTLRRLRGVELRGPMPRVALRIILTK